MTIFDVANQPFPWELLWSPAVGAIIGLLAVILEHLGWPRRSRFLRVVGFLMIFCGTASSIYYPLRWHTLQRNLIRSVREGNVETFEGAVQDIRTVTSGGKDITVLEIGDHRFTFPTHLEALASPCYSGSGSSNSEIKQGMTLRVKSKHNCILTISAKF
jgi:hypothetical protein